MHPQTPGARQEIKRLCPHAKDLKKKDVVPQTRKQRNANQRKGSSRNMHIHDPVKGSNQGKNVERNKKKDEEY